MTDVCAMADEKFVKEACVEGVAQAMAAESQGADRIELCSDLHLDGLSPDEATIAEVRKQISIPIRVMIRPRAGDFCYDRQEIMKMKEIIRYCKSQKVEGVVLGALLENGEINIEVTNELIQEARPLKTVFHRAIELTPDLEASVKSVFDETEVDAILTSGGPGKASDHYTLLKQLITVAGEKELVVCGKITDANLEETNDRLHSKSYHGKLIVGSLPQL